MNPILQIVLGIICLVILIALTLLKDAIVYQIFKFISKNTGLSVKTLGFISIAIILFVGWYLLTQKG